MAEQEGVFLRFLPRASLQQAKFLLTNISKSQLHALGEVCYNLLYGRFDPELLKSLKPHSFLLRQLSDKRISITKRRKLAAKKSKAVREILRLVADVLP